MVDEAFFHPSMSPASVSGIVFLSVFGGAFWLAGGRALPAHHLSWEAEGTLVKLGMGVVHLDDH